MTPHEEIDRASKAQTLLDDELLQSALAAIEAEVIKQWSECPARDKDGKEMLWQLYKTSQKFRGLLNGYVQTGMLSASNLKHAGDKRTLFDRIRAA